MYYFAHETPARKDCLSLTGLIEYAELLSRHKATTQIWSPVKQ
jgi:hypothetical protein